MLTLDSSQLAFCQADARNLRLLAPAGCGKTLSLLHRCKHLAQQSKSQRQRFLIVTFTVAAKQELQSRLNEGTDFSALADAVEVTTLNSWGFRRIRNAAFSPKLIVSKADYHFAMLNQLQAVWNNHSHVKAAIEQKSNTTPRKLMNVMDSFKSIGFDHVRHAKYEAFSGHTSSLRKQGLAWKLQELLDDLIKLGVLEGTSNKKGDVVPLASDRKVYDAFFKFWIEATSHLISNATFTLEDQKYVAYLDEKQKLEEGKFLSGAARYDHVLVDEFQDVNPLDLGLVNAITQRNRATLTIVGDDDQAIFEWRGATPEYILNPEQFFGTAFETHTLAVNYRSPANIMARSQRLIANNVRRVKKDITAFRRDDAKITIQKTASLSDAMEHVHSLVQKRIGDGHSPSRVAIIGRKRAQLIPYQVFFASKDVSFCAAEDLQVFMSGAFDRLLKLLMIKERAQTRRMRTEVVDDVLDLCHLVKRYPLSKADRESLRRHLQQSAATTLSAAVDVLASYTGNLKGKNADGRVSQEMVDAIRHFISSTTVSEALLNLGERFEGLQIDLGKGEDDIFFTDPPFSQLAEYASRYADDYVQFVDDIGRAKDQLAYVPPFEDGGQAGSTEELWKRPLHLMTALRAKGKEFDSVILLDVNDGIWPNKNAKSPEQLEAERRVFYVAFTRAKTDILILVSTSIGNKPAIVSPYLRELDLSLP